MNGVVTAVANGFNTYRQCLAAIALNTLLIFAVLMLNVAGGEFAPLTWLYVLGLAVGYYGLPLLLVGTIVYLVLRPARNASRIAGVLIFTLIIYFFLIDSFVFRIFKFHLNLFWIEFVLVDFHGLGLSRSTVVSAIALFAGVVGIEILIFRLSAVSRGLRRFALFFPVLALLAFGASQVIHVVAYQWNDQRITKVTPRLPLYVPIHSHSNAPKFSALLPWIGGNRGGAPGGPGGSSLFYPLKAPRFSTAEDTTSHRKPSFLFILLESWRFDTMDKSICPNIAALGERSSVFLNHLSSGNQTTCGIFGLFYGLHATYWPAVKANATVIDNPVLIDVLKERGYDFGIFARSSFERHKIKDTIFNGIKVHEDFAGNTIPLQDADLTKQTLEFIEEHERAGEPYMAFAFYKSSHAPYVYPPEYAPEINDGNNMAFSSSGTDPASRLAHYHASIRYNDDLVGEILARLESLGAMDHTVIIVTTDHGESFNDNRSNYWGHGSSYTQYQTRVPLILYAPGREARRVTDRTSHIDIPPTLLEEYLGCTSDPREYSNGINLFGDTSLRRPLVIGSYFNHAFIFGDDVYEVLPAYTKKYRLDDVNVEASPPGPELLREVAEEIGRFAAPAATGSDV